MDKFAKRLQSRLSAKGYRFNKEQCRQALAITAENPELPTDDEMIAAFDYLTQPLEPETIEAEPVNVQPSTIQPSTIQPSTIQPSTIQPSTIQPLTPETEAIAPAPLEKIEDSSLTVADNSPITQPVTSVSITPDKVTQAINQAAHQVGVQGDAEAIQALTSLATILSVNNKNTQDMVAALVSGYLGERQRILSSAIGTLNTLRSAQTQSFQSGLDEDFFQQREQSKRQFLNTIQSMFN